MKGDSQPLISIANANFKVLSKSYVQGGFMRIISILFSLAFSLSAVAGKLVDRNCLTNARLQQIYNFSMKHRHPSSNVGMCTKFQKIQSYILENDESDQNGAALFILRESLMSYAPEKMDLVTASRVDFDEDTFNEQIDSLSKKIIAEDAREEWKDMVKGIIKYEKENIEIYAGSIAFQNAKEHTFEHNILDHFSFVDLKTKQLFYFGAGVCEF